MAQSVGWAGPTGPAFGRPDDKLRDTHQLQFMTLMGFASLNPAARRPCERRDPYAVSSLLCIGADALRNHGRQGLWVPAFAGTTH